MNTYNTKQEILIATNSTFARRDLCENDFCSRNIYPDKSPAEKLEEACWNGMLDEWLPVKVDAGNSDKIFLWKVYVMNALLCAELSKSPSSVDPFYSVNPYLFLSEKNRN